MGDAHAEREGSHPYSHRRRVMPTPAADPSPPPASTYRPPPPERPASTRVADPATAAGTRRVAGVAAAAPAAAEPTVRFVPDSSRTIGGRRAAAPASAQKVSGSSPHAPNLVIDPDPAWHLARRAAHAGTAATAAAIASAGTTAWLESQLKPAAIDDSACERQVAAAFPLAGMSATGVRSATGNKPWNAPPAVARATLWRQLATRRPLLESVVEMWHDQLHVALFSDKIHEYVGVYDREVIRRHALGTFKDLLFAATTHPAMLLYLDNAGSTKANPNENLGRELLELHTVGVGAHTEADVKAAARLLTGLSVDWASGAFTYRPNDHATGPVTCVGLTLANRSTDRTAVLADVRRLTDHLATRPATVRRIVGRMARRFVADEPPSSLLDRLASAYVAGGTAIAPVLRALFTSREFATSVGAKWRRPQELMATLVAAGRPTYVPPSDTGEWAKLGTYIWLLETLGHVPLDHPDPDGPSDLAGSWLHPGALLARWNAAEGVAGRWDKTLAMSPWRDVFSISTSLTYAQAADRIVHQLCGIHPSAADRDTLARFLARPTGGPDTPAPTAQVSEDALRWHLDQTVRLAMASPYLGIR